jgi:type III secretion system FlhB-like substrate exporter
MGKITISESKKDTLLNLINEVENELVALLHEIEFDESVPDEVWDHVDNRSAEVFSKLNNLRDNIIFS